jgi:D-lactate dehydrogenase
MKIAFFSATKTDLRFFNQHNQNPTLQFNYFDVHLTEETVKLAEGHDGICAFVNDTLDSVVLKALKQYGISLITLRCAGFNNVDISYAQENDFTILRVPAYSPMAVAEHALALMMTLNRKTHKAFNRVRDGNFSIEGFAGFDMFNKTAGVVGTGKIGIEMCRILNGLGLNVLAYDPYPNESVKALGSDYVDLDTLYAESDIITLHVPLLEQTKHIINHDSIAKMKDGVMIINTSRGGLTDAQALIEGLKSRKIGYLGIDVYEQESNLFFEDHSEEIIDDDIFERLLTFPNVLVTGHQAFFTKEALDKIASTTIQNILDFENGTVQPMNCINCQI